MQTRETTSNERCSEMQYYKHLAQQDNQESDQVVFSYCMSDNNPSIVGCLIKENIEAD